MELQERNKEVPNMSVTMNNVLETLTAQNAAASKTTKNSEYGKTVGKPKLSEEGKK